MSVIRKFSSSRLLSVLFLSAALCFGVISPTHTIQPAEAGAKQDRGGKKMRGKRIGRKNMSRSGGYREKGRFAKSGNRGGKKGGYKIRRVRKMATGPEMHGGKKVGKFNKKVHRIRKKIHMFNKIQNKRRGDTDTRRSGVKLSLSGHKSESSRRTRRLVEIAGSKRRSIARHQLRGAHKSKGRRFSSGVSGTGLIVLGAASSAGQGMAPVAGGDEACAYGTYCTIDLGGPKIITFNDVGDFGEELEDEVLLDEELSDEEYVRKYGSK